MLANRNRPVLVLPLEDVIGSKNPPAKLFVRGRRQAQDSGEGFGQEGLNFVFRQCKVWLQGCRRPLETMHPSAGNRGMQAEDEGKKTGTSW